MKKIVLLAAIVLLVGCGAVLALDSSVINREDLSLKAGPTEPGEDLSIVWLESYVYPKMVKDDRVVSLGVRTTSKVRLVVAYFDFNKDQVALSSNDSMCWSGAYRLPDNLTAGLHVARYQIKGDKGTIMRTVEFFVEDSALASGPQAPVAQGETVYVKSWPLTVVSTCPALVGASSRILYAGEKIIGISKMPWYKVVFSDGEEGWVNAASIKEPLEEYYLLGYQAYVNKNYALAVDYYKSTIAIDPFFVKGHLWLAKSYLRLGEMDLSCSSILEAMQQDERNIDCRVFATELARRYFEIAHTKFRQERYNEAVAAYQKVLGLKPTSSLSWLELGKCYTSLDLPLEARSAWQEALRIEPENNEVLVLLNLSGETVRVAAVPKPEKKPALPVAKAEIERQVLTKAVADLPPSLADDSLSIVRGSKTIKGTKIEAALRSVVALTKSLGTPVVEKGWKTQKNGDKYLVRYLCEQGVGVVEAFEWLVDIDTKHLSANNDNAKILMERW